MGCAVRAAGIPCYASGVSGWHLRHLRLLSCSSPSACHAAVPQAPRSRDCADLHLTHPRLSGERRMPPSNSLASRSMTSTRRHTPVARPRRCVPSFRSVATFRCVPFHRCRSVPLPRDALRSQPTHTALLLRHRYTPHRTPHDCRLCAWCSPRLADTSTTH